MDRAFLSCALVAAILLLSGCTQKASTCSSNSDCSGGLFCVDGQCSSLECRGEGKECRNGWECCGSLECSAGICEKTGLENSVRVALGNARYANVYGTELKIGPVDFDFGQDCELRGVFANVELRHGKDVTRGDISEGSVIGLGSSNAKLETVTVNKSKGEACSVKTGYATVEISRNLTLTTTIAIGQTIQIPGTGAGLKLVDLTPTDPNFKWRSIELRKGDLIPNTGIAVASIDWKSEGDCGATDKKANLMTKQGGWSGELREGETAFIENWMVVVDSIDVLEDCKPKTSGSSLRMRIAEIPCRYQRKATLELSGVGKNTVVEATSGIPALIGKTVILLDSNELGCYGQSPTISANLSESGESVLAETTTAEVIKNVNLRLEDLHVNSEGRPCTVVGASADVFVAPGRSADSFSTTLEMGVPKQVGDLSLLLKSVNAELEPAAEKCLAQGLRMIFVVKTPDGTGGLFGKTVPEGMTEFIERSVTQKETTVRGGCDSSNEDSAGYTFDEKSRVLVSRGLGSTNATVAYGILKRVSGNSNAFKSSVIPGSIPLGDEEVEILGVNKAGDVNLIYRGKNLVLGVRESYTEESNSTEVRGDCSVLVNRIETIKNHGFVRISG